MPDRDPTSSLEFKAALARAQWAVIQTGLITSGLALFGVYVLATRINDLHLMSMYAPRWFPIGPLLTGLICGSGYILASWWFGVRVGPGMIATIVLIQIGMFFACHYSDFETLDLVYRDTGQSVSFFTYFDYTTRRLAAFTTMTAGAGGGGAGSGPTGATTQPSATIGYAIRAAEAVCFAAGGLLAALTLTGRVKCRYCGGLVRRRTIARVLETASFRKRLEEHCRIADLRGFDDEIARHAPDGIVGTDLAINRCEVCGHGTIDLATGERPATGVADAATTEGKGKPWCIPTHGDFARELFDRADKPTGPRGFPMDTTAAGSTGSAGSAGGGAGGATSRP